jgi:AraC-like DNA-binding protein
MREARRMLVQGSRVVDVAQQLGFVNVFHFSRRFKSLYRVAPSQVRSAGGDL